MKPGGCKFTDNHFNSLSILTGGCRGTDCNVANCPKRTEPETYYQAIIMFKNWMVARVLALQKEQKGMEQHNWSRYETAIDELNKAIDRMTELGLK